MKRLLAAAAIILAATSSHAANIRTTNGIVWIKGEIDQYDYGRFYDAVRGIPPGGATVNLDSPGGNVQAGLDIGNYIHGYSFATKVDAGSFCTSICAAIWLAGTRRFIEAGAYIGFHSTSLAEERSDQGNQVMRGYYQNMGLRKDIIDVLLSYDPKTINWLTVEMSKVLGITYEVQEKYPGGVRWPDGGVGRSYQHWGDPPPPDNAMPMRPDRENPENLNIYEKSAANGFMQGVKDRERLRPLGYGQFFPLWQKSREYGEAYIVAADGKHDQFFEQDLRSSAAKFGDQYMINTLNTRGLQGAAWYIGWLDAMTKPEAVTRPRN
jgi:hypothetical protein